MQLLVALLAVWLVLALLGFLLHLLWIVALVLAAAWLLGLAFRRRDQNARWYRW